MKTRNKLAITIFSGLVLVGCSSSSVDTTITKKDEILMSVDGKNVTNNDYNTMLLNQLTYSATLDELDFKVLDPIYSKDQRVIDELKNNEKSFKEEYTTESKQNEQYALYGAANYEEYILKAGVKLNAYSKFAVMDYAFDKVYTKDEKQYAYDYKIEVTGKYSMILVAPSVKLTSTTDEITAAQAAALKKAQEINKKITDKASFEAAAKESSDDKLTGANGGYIGEITRSTATANGLSRKFVNEAFLLTKDTFTTTPIETEYGYVIIYCNDTNRKSMDESKELISKALYDVYSTENSTFNDYVMDLYREANNIKFAYGPYSSKYAQNVIQTKLKYRQNDQSSSYGY